MYFWATVDTQMLAVFTCPSLLNAIKRSCMLILGGGVVCVVCVEFNLQHFNWDRSSQDHVDHNLSC